MRICRIKQSFTWRGKKDLMSGARPASTWEGLGLHSQTKLPLLLCSTCMLPWTLGKRRYAHRGARLCIPGAGFESSKGCFLPRCVRMDSDLLNFRDLKANSTSEPVSQPLCGALGHHAWLGRVAGWGDLLPRKASDYKLTVTTAKLQVSNSAEPPTLGTPTSGEANAAQTAEIFI